MNVGNPIILNASKRKLLAYANVKMRGFTYFVCPFDL